MQQKWKYIIANWINCYFYKNNNKNEVQVNHESLLNIISHLRENFNLDESKSSIFGGHSVEDFILEKYPNFKFENGTVEVANEEEVYIAASLLLFFVCVNSKDIDIKNAMCSKLSTSDQNVILKFSKSLMECHSISSHDVVAAITEACGPDAANGESSRGTPLVAETPPALRSLHGEVRRLQAALDAERFDKNYLQDELARTNLKLEKLAKDKEQYKAEIMDLKVKTSMCCGQETESRGDEAKSNEMVKLSRQLQQMEQRVCDVQEQLDEVQHDRDTYKAKLDDLKGECDRLLMLSRDEATRANRLADELDTERRQSQTLRELVVELRQHNHLNGFDTSLLECDDPDTSVQSLQRSFSVCSEVCANVVEVQLGEERAKCLALKQQIQSLQDNMNELVQKTEILQKIITDRENDIFNLKHRINEEIEEKNNLKSYFEYETTKSNNIVNELEQKLKDNSKHSNLVIEKKMQDIQVLQEEKLSLLQSLSDESTKSENMIKDLKVELDAEKALKMKMRDEYENLVMKMKEKVLNRNNELVELQNNISQNSDLIEQLNLELRQEKEFKDETINKYNKDMALLTAQQSNLEKDLEGKCVEITELLKQIHQRDAAIEEMVKMKEEMLNRTNELVELHNNALQKSEIIEVQNLELRKEMELKDEIIHKCNEDMELLNSQKRKVEEDLQGKFAEISELVKQIHQRDTCIDEAMKIKENLLNKNNELLALQNNILQKNELIEHQNLELRIQMELKNEIIHKCNKDMELLNLQKSKVETVLQSERDEITQLRNQIIQRDASIKQMMIIKEEILNKNNELVELQNNILQKSELIEQQNLEFRKVTELKDETINKYNIEIEFLKAQKSKIEENLQGKCAEITELVKQIQKRDTNFDEIMKIKEEVLKRNSELVELQNNVLLKSKIIEVQNLELQREIELKDKTINQYNKDIELFNAQKSIMEENLHSKCAEITELLKQIHQRDAAIEEMAKMKEEALNRTNELVELHNNALQKREIIEVQNLKLCKEMELKDETICKYNNDIEGLKTQKSKVEEDLQSKCMEITDLLKQIQRCDASIEEMVKIKEEILNKNNELVEFQNNVMQKSEQIEQQNLELHKEIELKDETIYKCNKEMEILNAQNSNLEKDLQGKCAKITDLVKQIKQRDVSIDEMMKNLEYFKTTATQNSLEVTENLNQKLEIINKLEEKLSNCNKIIISLEGDKVSYQTLIAQLEKKRKDLDDVNEVLRSDKVKLTTQKNKLELQIETLDMELQVLNKELIVLKKENSDLLGVIDQKRSDITKLEQLLKEERNEKTAMSQTFENEKFKYLSEYNILQEKYSKTLEELDKKSKELSKYQDVLNNNTDVIKDLEKANSESIKLLTDLNKEKEILEKEKDSLIEEKNSNSMKISKLEEEIRALTFEEIPTLKEKNNHLTNMIEENEIAIEKMLNRNNELAELQKNVLQKMELIEQLNLQLKKEMELKDETIHKCNKDMEILKVQRINLEKDLQAKCSEITDLVKQIHQRDVSIDEIKENVLNTNNLAAELQNNVLQKSELIEQLNLELQRERELKDKVINKYNKEIEILYAQKSKVEDDLQNKCSEITDLVKQLHQRDMTIEEIMNELEHLKTTSHHNNLEIAENLKQKSDTIAKLEKKLSNREKTIDSIEADKINYQTSIAQLQKEIKDLKYVNDTLKNGNDKLTIQKNEFEMQTGTLHQDLQDLNNKFNSLKDENSELLNVIDQKELGITKLEQEIKQEENEKTVISQTFENEKLKYVSEYNVLQENLSTTLLELDKQNKELSKCQDIINNNNNVINNLEKTNSESKKVMEGMENEKDTLIAEKNCNLMEISKLKEEIRALTFEEIPMLKETNLNLTNMVEDNKAVIATLENAIKKELEQNEALRKESNAEKFELTEKCNTLRNKLQIVEQEISRRNVEINALQEQILNVKSESAKREEELKEKNKKITDIIEEKDALICKINDELSNEMLLKDQYKKEAELKDNNIRELQNILTEEKHAMVEALMSENRMLTKQIAQIESNAAQDKSPGQWNDGQADKKQDDLHPQVDCISSTNICHSDSNKTIRDLEIILNDKNRTITALQIDINFLKSLMAESENKVLDLTKDLEESQENCQQLSNQLKKILHQKNEEIVELKNKISKVSAMENRASQIIKVSAKYQEIIHKRMAEIKSNTVLKELTNFGSAANGESDLKRSLNSGTITMKDLETFLETTDRHIRRCSEKRFALQKERDRLVEVNRINESEIISVRKFLTELSVTVKTFNSVKEIYTRKLSVVVSLQRTARREILNVEGRLTDAAVCKLERGYAATMQDLAECIMNLERWVERSIGRAISAEKIKQAFTSDNERNSLAPATFQNASLEAQIDQLENSFQKLLEEAVRAQKGDGAKDSLAMTVQEVRAEYEEKLARMKTKMKELYQKEVQRYKEAQREEVATLHQELQSTKEKFRQSRKEYEEEIRSLTLELWNVGEKFLDEANEADRLRRKQRSESLMSLQHVPSSRFATQTEEPCRQSDTHSLRSLPLNVNKKREGRGLHMSDEEGEVFDNRCLRELNTPRAPRLSELRWRNSLCPPHLKSSYPAETQFDAALHEEDIKAGPANASAGRSQRKEVGITAYKKPGPPTPSKQAGRLSATDSELRESLRVENEPQPRRTTTPSRLRSLFTSARSDNVEGTPRSRRLSNFFRKK